MTHYAEMPEGTRYVAAARGLMQGADGSGGPRRHAVALGCEARQAADFVYRLS